MHVRAYAAAVLMACTGWQMSATAQPSTAASPPTGLSFIAQDESGAWGLWRLDSQARPVRLQTQLEPRQACVSPDGAVAVYTAADGTLRRTEGVREAVLARADATRAYTQPCMTADGRDIVVVEMADGKSVDTEILRFSGSAAPVRVARQPGAQHDPFLHQGRWLVYANVHCSDGCERLIVEIWLRDLVAAEARQLTLLNALSQGPVTDGQRVVFASNATGTFQLWQVGMDGTAPRQLTQGAAQATQPALCGGDVYFVQATPRGAVLARLTGTGRTEVLPTPGLQSIRAVRCLS